MSHAEPSPASDIVSRHWGYRVTPAAAHPYLRLIRFDRPIGTWLLLFPCWWSLALAGAWSGHWPEPRLVLLFALGALVMRGAGCVINDLWDREIDGRVARTAGRPIPSGQVTPGQALVFLAALLLAGLVILLQLSPTAIWLGIASLGLVAVYPLMKRVTYWPQAWLGLTFNWGALMGWAAATGELAWPPLLLYGGGIAWTLGYDTIYAHQDRDDDALVGVKSSALRLGAWTRPWLAVFYAVAALLFLLAGLTAGLGWLYAIGLLAVIGHFAWQIATLDIDDPANCLLRFKSNRFVGWLLLAGILAELSLA